MAMLDFSKWKHELILAVMILFFIAGNLVWFQLDLAPPMWDQSHYLAASEHLFRTLKEQGLVSFYHAYTNTFGTKAPLVTVLPVPFFYLFGNTYQSALYVNLAFILICSLYLYKLASFIADKKAALLTVFILNTFPLTFAMSREVLVEYGLMTLVIAWMYHLIRLDASSRLRDAVGLGTVLGLGMLMKLSYIVYIAIPTLFLIAARYVEYRKPPDHWIRNLLIVVSLGAVIAGTWYLKNLSDLINFAFASGYGEIAYNYGTGDVFTIDAIRIYWLNVINTGISFYYFPLILACAMGLMMLAMFQPALFDSGDRSKARYHFFILAWFLAPFLLFTFAVNKDYRYTLPYYPALALFCGIGLALLASSRYLKPLAFLLLLFPLLNYLNISFINHPHQYTWGSFIVLAPHIGYAHPPIKDYWPNLELLEAVENDARDQGHLQTKVTLLFDHSYLNQLTMNYYAANQGSNLRFDTLDYFSKDTDEALVRRISDHTDYIVTKADKLGPDFSNVKNVRVKAILDEGVIPLRAIATFPLPDNTVIDVLRKENPASQPLQSPPILLSIGPPGTRPGVGFNRQLNGESAMWAQGENITPTTIIVFNNTPLHGFQSSQQGIITTPVPDEMFSTAGQFPIYLMDSRNSLRSNELTFHVE